ncbi:MAG TPA: D-aminoacyl-tRNA deacylase, partial [Polyangiaceae bacterium]
LVGVGRDDTEQDAQLLAEKIVGLRIFADPAGKMNLAVTDCGGSLLAVSQFTLYGDVRKGKRPSFTQAMEPDRANHLFALFCGQCRELGVSVETGVFGAHMQVELVNDGPVTILIDTKKII